MNGWKASETDYFVTDMAAAIEFYTNVIGFKLIKRYDFGFTLLDVDGKGGKIGLFDLKTFQSSDLKEDGFPRPRLAIHVSDITQTTSELTARGAKVSDILGDSGGSRCAHVFDADGNSLFLWEDGSGTVEA